MAINLFRKFTVGRVVRMFILSDLALLSGWGLVGPIFAVFILERIEGATIIVIGASAAVYWITKAIVQLPIASFLDSTPSEKDDFAVLVLGLILVGFSALGFIFIDQVWQLYLVQFIHSIAFAMYTPAWSGIFSRHLDKHHEAMEWSMDNAGISLATGVTGLLGALLATWLGFNIIFIACSFLSFAAAAITFSVPRVVFPHRIHKPGFNIRNHKPIASSHE
ncbi:MAG: MFS transporter [Patescibacteria group bacterium]